MNFKRISFRPNEAEQMLLEQAASSTGAQSVTETIRGLLANLAGTQGHKRVYRADKNGGQSATVAGSTNGSRVNNLGTDGSIRISAGTRKVEERYAGDSSADMETMHNLMMQVASLDQTVIAQRQRIAFLEQQTVGLQQQLQQQMQQQQQHQQMMMTTSYPNTSYSGIPTGDHAAQNQSYPYGYTGLADRTNRAFDQIIKDTELIARWKRDLQTIRGW